MVSIYYLALVPIHYLSFVSFILDIIGSYKLSLIWLLYTLSHLVHILCLIWFLYIVSRFMPVYLSQLVPIYYSSFGYHILSLIWFL